MKSPLCALLGIKYPVFQGGMAWVADASLAAAVSEAGGLGLILSIGLIIGLSRPFQPMLGATGHYSLMMLIITVGLWIFKPFGLSFGAASGLLMAALLAVGVPAEAD